MRAKFTRLLLLAHADLVNGAAEQNAKDDALPGYSSFCSPAFLQLNVLEEQTLEALHRECMAYDCPELPQSCINASALWIAPCDRARSVVLSVLSEESPLQLLNQLLAHTGFASHCLLIKLLDATYVRQLCEADSGSGTAYRDFQRITERESGKLHAAHKYVADSILADLNVDLGTYVSRYGAKSSGFDLGLFEVMRTNEIRVGLLAEITQQLDLWLKPESLSVTLLDDVCEFLQVVLQFSLLTARALRGIRSHIVKLVMQSRRTECLALFRVIDDPTSVQRLVSPYLKADCHRSISPQFILQYIAYVKGSIQSAKHNIGRIWRWYLPDVFALHHVLVTCDEPRTFFNQVPYKMLLGFFVDLHTMLSDDPRRIPVMSDLMRLLDFESFVLLLMKTELSKTRELLRFMLGCLDQSTKAVYLSEAQDVLISAKYNSKTEELSRSIVTVLESYGTSTVTLPSTPSCIYSALLNTSVGEGENN
ncbi:hypothetical protein PAPHI01_2236 [Pancytospora philotis]|nr:hypothetical protein PAPHI01_2236 [Pancytospora philotis]